jgi:hypothetical protein
LTSPRNITLGQAIEMWCLLGINIPPFQYLQIDDRRLSDYEYNVEVLDHWPWSKMFTLMNGLEGGGKNEEDKIWNILRKILCEIKFAYIGENDMLTLTKIRKDKIMQFFDHCVNSEKIYKWEITEDNVWGIIEIVEETNGIIRDIEKKVLDYGWLDLSKNMKESLKFANDLLLLNMLNEMDRSLLIIDNGFLTYVQFGGKKSLGVMNVIFELIKRTAENNGIVEKVFYRRYLYSDGINMEENMTEFTEMIVEHEELCKLVIKKFNEDEVLKMWEPKVKRIKVDLTPEEFTVKILKEVFSRGYADYYFNQKCEEYMMLAKDWETREAVKVWNEIRKWKKSGMGKVIEQGKKL